jgi:hypothetical protein
MASLTSFKTTWELSSYTTAKWMASGNLKIHRKKPDAYGRIKGNGYKVYVKPTTCIAIWEKREEIDATMHDMTHQEDPEPTNIHLVDNSIMQLSLIHKKKDLSKLYPYYGIHILDEDQNIVVGGGLNLSNEEYSNFLKMMASYQQTYSGAKPTNQQTSAATKRAAADELDKPITKKRRTVIINDMVMGNMNLGSHLPIGRDGVIPKKKMDVVGSTVAEMDVVGNHLEKQMEVKMNNQTDATLTTDKVTPIAMNDPVPIKVKPTAVVDANPVKVRSISSKQVVEDNIMDCDNDKKTCINLNQPIKDPRVNHAHLGGGEEDINDDPMNIDNVNNDDGSMNTNIDEGYYNEEKDYDIPRIPVIIYAWEWCLMKPDGLPDITNKPQGKWFVDPKECYNEAYKCRPKDHGMAGKSYRMHTIFRTIQLRINQQMFDAAFTKLFQERLDFYKTKASHGDSEDVCDGSGPFGTGSIENVAFEDVTFGDVFGLCSKAITIYKNMTDQDNIYLMKKLCQYKKQNWMYYMVHYPFLRPYFQQLFEYCSSFA